MAKKINWLCWFVLVILWNYGVPDAAPIEDVLMAMLIGFITYKLKVFLSNPVILKKNKYFGSKK